MLPHTTWAMTKSTLLFADTSSILVAHMCGQWHHLCTHYDVRIVDEVEAESSFYFAADGTKHFIFLGRDVAAGKVTLVRVNLAQISELATMLLPGTFARMDPGELALVAAAMQMGEFAGMAVVTGDGAAIGVAEGLGIRVVSLESALQDAGGRPSLPAGRSDATEVNVARLKGIWAAKRVQGLVFHAERLRVWQDNRPLP